MLHSRMLSNFVRISSRTLRTSAIRKNVEAAPAASEKMTIPVPEGSDKPFNPKLDSIVNQISALNILEVSELSTLLKKKLNIPDTAMMPMGFAQAAPSAAGEDDEEAAPKKVQTAFKVKIIKFDTTQKVALIKEVKNLFDGMNLVQAKKFVESAPTILKEDVTKEEAEKLKEALTKVGAEIEIESMHNVTADQIEKNKQLIQLVKGYPQIYNHDPTQQQNGETVEEIWVKIGQELQETPESCKKKWRLLRSSLIRYIKVFKDKSTSKGNRYRPYYLLEHMDFLLPFIDDKSIIRKVKPIIKSPQQQTVTVVKKNRPEEETILYTSTPNTITYSVQTVATSSKDSSSQDIKADVQQQTQDIQQFYNHAGVKIIGEDYITTYPSGEQLIYQTSSGQTVEEMQQQQQECIQHETEQNECVQQDSPSKQQMTNATIIPIPNVSNVFSSTNPSEASDLYFLIGLLPDFRNLSHDAKPSQTEQNIKLISIIKKNRCLYDHSDPNYKNSVFVDRGWQDVSKEFGEPVSDCKKKWRHLRSSLSRYLKSSKDELKNKSNKLKPYYLLTHMNFLVPYTKTLDTKSDLVVCNKFDPPDENQVSFDEEMKTEEEPTSFQHEIIQDEDSHEIESNIVYEAYEIQEQIPTSSATSQSQPKSQITLVRSSHSNTNPNTSVQQLPLTIGSSKSQPQTLQLNASQISQFQPQQSQNQTQASLPMQNTIIPIPDDQSSADLNFFLALLPDIKIMNQEQKRKLRIGTLKLIDSILSNSN
ncbi:CLUMA_CG000067, isoform A [Clunio marinus]|uniref:CLUMA_CG000067, isoform A n=1 Tax=Clunio marinus TaxID=568069 RepID=A0A1J1HG20_9DIPT|nr:CLUMA_CG000067, isoform A [Clunio marinus]